MPTRVKLPDGSTGVFPDDMTDAQIEAVIRKEFPPGVRPGGGEPTYLSPAQPESIWQRLTRAKSEFLDSEDPQGRAEARAAGIGLQPTPREMAQAALAGATAGAAPVAAVAGAPYFIPAAKASAIGAGTAVAAGAAGDVVSGVTSGRPLSETVERSVTAAPNRAMHGAVLGPFAGRLAATPTGQAALTRLGPIGRYLLEYLSKSGQLPLKF